MRELLKVRDLSVDFATDRGTVEAVRGVSFDVAPAETLGIVGESASGKTVTALSIPQLLPSPPAVISGGPIEFRGTDLLTLDRQALRRLRGSEIGVVFQDPMTSLNPVRRIGVQMTEGMEAHLGMTASQARHRAVELLEQVGIPSPAQRLRSYPHELSGGMRQRVMIAIALSREPSLLIADEPTTALDVTVQAQIVDLVKQIREERDMAIVWITHDLSLLTGLTDRILVMYGGRVMEEAPTRELYTSPQHPYTIGLLNSIVDGSTRRGVRLSPIRGTPPERGAMYPGCPFAPRCDYAIERCSVEQPPDEVVGPAHRAACWVMPRRAPVEAV